MEVQMGTMEWSREGSQGKEWRVEIDECIEEIEMDWVWNVKGRK